jgi:hypothetical protein|tara:strand:- start:352 stop:606 length:255 start_codon:yes stop_codon:yes gene_type:complete
VNGKDQKDLNVILERMNQADRDRDEIHTDIKFIKENLFNPKEGLWSEVKDNSRFRENTSKWRTVSGTAIVGMLGKFIYDFFDKG